MGLGLPVSRGLGKLKMSVSAGVQGRPWAGLQTPRSTCQGCAQVGGSPGRPLPSLGQQEG